MTPSVKHIFHCDLPAGPERDEMVYGFEEAILTMVDAYGIHPFQCIINYFVSLPDGYMLSSYFDKECKNLTINVSIEEAFDAIDNKHRVLFFIHMALHLFYDLHYFQLEKETSGILRNKGYIDEADEMDSIALDWAMHLLKKCYPKISGSYPISLSGKPPKLFFVPPVSRL